MKAWSRPAPALSVAAGVGMLVFGMATRQQGPSPSTRPYTTWSAYGGSADSMQYSALAQIDKENVRELQRAWFYAIPGPPIRLPFNPLIVGDVMYVRGQSPPRGSDSEGGDDTIVALEAATGRERWSVVVEGNLVERGLHYWESADRADRRILYWADSCLRAIDAETGAPITTFGEGGRVDLRVGLGRDPRTIGNIQSRNPGRIFENLLIVGSVTGEGYGAPAGDVRAYDVVTGRLVWTFHTIPRPGEPGYETWPKDAWKRAGGANAWGGMSLDEERGIVYVPTGSPTADLYGADRAGDNLFANCLIALDARTGKRLWHFQAVHHDLWDYDLAASPNLLTVRRGGEKVDIVAQAGKTGFLYVFNRETGEPLWPIEERPVPRSEVPGEESSPTQPFPTQPPPFSRQVFRPEDVNPFVSAEEQASLRRAVREAANDGLFTPSGHLRHHIQLPGAWGGANWGSTAADPATGRLFVRSLEMPSYRRMSHDSEREDAEGRPAPSERAGRMTYARLCAACHGPGQTPMPSPAALGKAGFRRLLRQGLDQMPAFSDAMLPAARVDALEAYLVGLPVDEESAGDRRLLRLPRDPSRYAGPAVRYSGAFSAGWYTSNGLPAIGPPWTTLVAYDLNDGRILWRVPDGESPGLAEQGITNTGSVRPRNGPVVTAGGLVFLANAQDRTIRAYDADTGEVRWSYELEANPEGVPAVYEVAGRQYIVFSAGASWGTGSDPIWRNAFHRKRGTLEAQGYHAFALPEGK